MKLPIKKKWFDMIESGEKTLEWRDAHITFVCEETGRTLRREVISVQIFPKNKIDFDDCSKEELNKLFEDDNLMGFVLR